MRIYKVVIDNGMYPLSRDCDSIAEAYGCVIEQVSRTDHVRIDPEKLMEILVQMKNGDTLELTGCGFRVIVRDREG